MTNKELVSLLKEALDAIDRYSQNLVYGAPLVDDPRDYTPVPGCCSEKEIQAWKEACEKAERGEHVEVPQHFRECLSEKGGVVHISYQPWGIGTSVVRHPKMKKLMDKIKVVIAALEGGDPA